LQTLFKGCVFHTSYDEFKDQIMSALPAQMTAIAITAPGGPEVLVAVQAAVPQPGPGQILIKVAAAGVNRPDVLQRTGGYPAPKAHSELPGLEVAGHVAAVGAGALRYQIGDAVMALVNGGGYATYCVADEGCALPVPLGMPLVEAAGLPETFFTVWHNVFERGQLTAGDWFLVHGGTSGIGVAAIQLAKAFGAHVIATAGSDEKCAACLALGADRAVNYATSDFVEVVKEATGARGVAVILDMVGGDYVERNIRCAADDGRIVNIAYQKGSKVTIDLIRVMLKRLTLTGSTLRIRTSQVKAGIASQVEQHLLPLIAAGRVRIVMDHTFTLENAADAHRRLESGQHIGKVVLTVG
jgi:NADPH:quinone reductase